MVGRKLTLLGMAIALVLGVNAQQTAFPGAQGYGKYASGGRGNGQNGKLAIVTNLEDDLDNPPEGSFRWALAQGRETINDPILGSYTVQRPLTIVFQVGGVINLKGELRAKRHNMTIAGQTAPGDGICFRGATVNFGGSQNVIIRYIRFRPGDELGAETSALRIENGANFIIDHCSMSWGIEETTHFSSNDNTTVQWCILSESLYNSIHKKGERGYAAQWGGEYASYHHNLLAHNRSRMPRINGSNSNDVEALVDYRNNVNYNWGGLIYGGEFEGTPNCTGFSHVNLVNNYFIPGPASEENSFASPSTNRGGVTLCGYAKWYVNGNFMLGSEQKTSDNWLGIKHSNKDSIRSDIEHVQSDGVLENYDYYTQSAEDAYNSVINNVGATLPKRDVIDERVINEVIGDLEIVRYAYEIEGQNTPIKGVGSGIIDTQKNLVPNNSPEGTTAWDVYSSSTDAPLDTDNDGMPDDWEDANGLNKEDNSDFKLIADNGYSNLENYLNSNDIISAIDAEVLNEQEFRVYPNPSKNWVRFSSLNNIDKIEIYNFSGKLIDSIRESDTHKKYSVHKLKPGIYLVKATFNNNQFAYHKIVKQ